MSVGLELLEATGDSRSHKNPKVNMNNMNTVSPSELICTPNGKKILTKASIATNGNFRSQVLKLFEKIQVQFKWILSEQINQIQIPIRVYQCQKITNCNLNYNQCYSPLQYYITQFRLNLNELQIFDVRIINKVQILNR